MTSKGNKKFRLLLLTALIILVVKMLFVGVTLQNGFDLVDEGYHLLHYKYPEAYSVNVHNYQYLVSSLIGGSVSVIKLRRIWYFVEILSVLFLVYSLFQYFELTNSERTVRYGFVVVVFGALFTGVHDRILAYNSLSNFCALSTFSGLIYSQTLKRHEFRMILLFVSGLIASVSLYVKLSTGVGLIIISVGLLIAVLERKGVTPFLLGALIGGFGFAAIFLPPLQDWWSAYVDGIQLAKVSGYGSNLMLKMYALQTIYFIVVLGFSIFPVLLLGKRLLQMPKLEEYRGWVLVVGHVVSQVIMFCLFTIGQQEEYCFELYGLASSIRYYPVIAIPHTIAYALLIGITKKGGVGKGASSSQILVLISLIGLPVVIIFGAFSSVPMSLYGHLAPLLSAMYLVPLLLWKQPYVKTFMPYLVVFTTIFCGLFFIHNYILYPARLLEPLTEQVVDIGQGESIMVDTQTAAFLEELRQKVGDNESTESILHIGNQPGIVYLLDRYQPGTAMYISVPFMPEIEPMNLAYAEYYIEDNKREIENSILLINAGVHPNYFRTIEKGGLLLDGSHVLLDSVYNPYLVREMVANELIKSPYTYIYTPTAP